MEPINPYALPQAIGQPSIASETTNSFGAWRIGNLLVVTAQSQLPSRCVKCNAPVDERRLAYKLAWHRPLVYWLYLLGVLPYLIVRIAFQKKLTVYVGVCRTHRNRAFNAILIGFLGSIAGLFLIAFHPGFRQPSGWQVFAGCGLLLLAFGVLVYGLLVLQIVWAKKICDDRAWVKGVCQEYLADFPEYTG